MLEEILSEAVTHTEWVLVLLVLAIIAGPLTVERLSALMPLSSPRHRRQGVSHGGGWPISAEPHIGRR